MPGKGRKRTQGVPNNPRDPVPPALGVLHTLAWQGAPQGAAAGAAPAWKCLDAAAPETITSMGMTPPCLKTQEKRGKEGKKQLGKLRAAAPSSEPALSSSLRFQ